MRRGRRLILGGVFLVLAAPRPAEADEPTFRERVAPFLAKYCNRCHGDPKPKAGLNLAAFRGEDAVAQNRKAWAKVFENLDAGLMPPEDQPQPSEAEIEPILRWINAELAKDDCRGLNDPGRVTLRRLNRAEYNNTIRDLVGVDFHPADDFPSDDVGYGFDNIGDVLTLPPILMEKYLAAAEVIAEKAIVVPQPSAGPTKTWEVETLGTEAGGQPYSAMGRALYSDGEIGVKFDFPEDGQYRVRVRAFGQQAGPEPVKMELRLDGKPLKKVTVRAEEAAPEIYEALLRSKAGPRRLAVAFLNDYYQPDDPNPAHRDRNLIIDWIAVQGPSNGGVSPGPIKHWEVETLGDAGGEPFKDNGRILTSTGEIGTTFDFPRKGTYRLRVRAFGQQAGPEKVKMELRLNGKPVKLVEVAAEENEPGIYEAKLQVDSGKKRLAAAFLNDYYQPDDPNPAHRDRNLIVDWIEIQGPSGDATRDLPGSHKRILFRKPAKGEERDCARAILERFASRAYRRPATKTEVERLVDLAMLALKQGEPFERGIQLGVIATLVSPHFLYHVEVDRGQGPPGPPRPLNDFELAARLSYFLWSSMPDETLFDLARKKELHRAEVLEAQARRMLRDPKAQALVANFAGQWLQLRLLKTVTPDPKRFPSFDEALRAAMQRETELFFQAVMTEDRSILDFLDADYTFVNERLARHYGIPNIQGDQFRKVALRDQRRGGLITQASILTVTSNPTRTAPVKRGKWILEQLLGTPPPPPPPDVPQLKEEREGPLSGTLRQKMEQHRANPSCASCHAQMDPLGFGLENFDAIGAWRDKEGDLPIDASGTLPTGQSFQGPKELRALLRGQDRAFARCLTEKMLTYALGRGLEAPDACHVDKIVAALARDKHRFSRLVVAIVTSDPFRKRKGQEP
jgi:hypothetical protein